MKYYTLELKHESFANSYGYEYFIKEVQISNVAFLAENEKEVIDMFNRNFGLDYFHLRHTFELENERYIIREIPADETSGMNIINYEKLIFNLNGEVKFKDLELDKLYGIYDCLGGAFDFFLYKKIDQNYIVIHPLLILEYTDSGDDITCKFIPDTNNCYDMIRIHNFRDENMDNFIFKNAEMYDEVMQGRPQTKRYSALSSDTPITKITKNELYQLQKIELRKENKKKNHYTR